MSWREGICDALMRRETCGDSKGVLMGGDLISDDVPMKQQGRAWTSPIWYSPT